MGQRIPKKQSSESISASMADTNISSADSSDSNETDETFEPLVENAEISTLSCTEIYLIAAKRDSTLVDVKG